MSGKRGKNKGDPEAKSHESAVLFLRSTDFANSEEMDAKEDELERQHPGTNVVQLIKVDGTGHAIWKES